MTILAIIYTIAVASLWLALRSAPTGWQDDSGFHYGVKDEE